MSAKAKPAPKAANLFRGAVATTKDLEECFGVTKVWIGKLAEEGKLSKAGHGRWNAFDSVRLFIEHLRTRKVNQHSSGDDENSAVEFERQRARKMKADAEIAEVTADLLMGRVHEGKAVEELWRGMQMSCRSKLLSLPSKIAAVMPADLSAKVLEASTEIIHEALEQLADYDAQKIAERTDKRRLLDPTPTADDEAVEASAKVESEPMG